MLIYLLLKATQILWELKLKQSMFLSDAILPSYYWWQPYVWILMFYIYITKVFIFCTKNSKSPPNECDEINNPQNYNDNRLKKPQTVF